MKKSFIFSLLFVSISMRAMEHPPKVCSSTASQMPEKQSLVIVLRQLKEEAKRLADAQEEANALVLFKIHMHFGDRYIQELMNCEETTAALKAALAKYNLFKELPPLPVPVPYSRESVCTARVTPQDESYFID